MDLWKVVLVGAALLGLVVLFLVATGPGDLPTPPDGRLLDEGTFVLEQGGVRLGEEKFAVWVLPNGFRIDSTATLGREERRSWAVVGADWTLHRYEAVRMAPRVWETISARAEEGQVVVETKAGLSRQTKRLPEVPPVVVVHHPAVGLWYTALRLLVQGGGTFSALVLGESRIAPVEGAAPQAVGLRIPGRILPVERYRVRLGDEEVVLYGQGELLIGIEIPAKDFLAYMVEILPTGLEEVEL